MPITHGHSFLVHPGKGLEQQPKILGTKIDLSGKLFDMLTRLYEGADKDCDIEIAFTPDEDGRQNNPARSLLLSYLAMPGMKEGRTLAERLQGLTTRVSGLGLLFVVAGKHKERHQLLVARFPADEGVVAAESGSDLNLDFVERVFMKSLKAYKSVMYHTTSVRAGFWNGWAVDKQINSNRELSNYWIRGFLESDFRTTGAAGTRRLGQALRSAMATASDEVKEELWAAARMLRNLDGERVSIDSVGERLRLSPEASNAIKDALPKPELCRERFQFTVNEYDSVVAFRSVELSTGVRVVAPNDTFERHVHTEQVDGAENRVRLTTTGKVVGKRVGKSG